jgi:hypothetical protein
MFLGIENTAVIYRLLDYFMNSVYYINTQRVHNTILNTWLSNILSFIKFKTIKIMFFFVDQYINNNKAID